MITTSKKNGTIPSTLIFNLHNKSKNQNDSFTLRNDRSSIGRDDLLKKNESEPNHSQTKFGSDLFNEHRKKWMQVFYFRLINVEFPYFAHNIFSLKYYFYSHFYFNFIL